MSFRDEFLIPITPENFEIPLQSVGQRPDTSWTQLYVKVALAPNDDVPESAVCAYGVHFKGPGDWPDGDSASGAMLR